MSSSFVFTCSGGYLYAIAHRAARRAQLVVQSQLIDFHDDTVDLVLDIVTVFAVVADVIGGGID